MKREDAAEYAYKNYIGYYGIAVEDVRWLLEELERKGTPGRDWNEMQKAVQTIRDAADRLRGAANLIDKNSIIFDVANRIE